MKRTKHTHTGHCQVCGQMQAVDNATGLLSLHGYKVEFSCFNGECFGSRELPFEKDKTLVEKSIAVATEHVKHLRMIETRERNRTDLAATGYIYFTNQELGNPTRVGRYGETKLVDFHFEEDQPLNPGTTFTSFSIVGTVEGVPFRKPCHRIIMFYGIYGADQAKYAKAAHDDLADHWGREAKQLEMYIKNQQARIKDWKVTDLFKVPETKEPTRAPGVIRRRRMR